MTAVPDPEPPRQSHTVIEDGRPLEHRPRPAVHLRKIEPPGETPAPAPPAPKPREPNWTDAIPGFNPHVNFALTKPFLAELFRRLDTPIWLPADAVENKALAAREDAAREEIAAASFDSARFAWQEAHSASAKAIAEGKPPPPIPDLAKLKEQAAARRQQARAELRSVREAFRPIAARNAERLAAAAKKLAQRMLEEEKKEAAKWGGKFEPSTALLCVAWLANSGFGHIGAHATSPSDFLSNSTQ